MAYGNEELNGNTSDERFYGGDVTPLTTNQPVLCAALDALGTATPQYRIDHEWQNGHVARSQYDGTSFFTRDLTIDLHGLVTSSRDPAGLQTSYGYDTNWRLSTITPPGEASTSYQYTNAVASGTALNQPAKVLESTQSDTAGLVKREYQYDSFGRLWRQKQWMPDSQWSMRETLYDTLAAANPHRRPFRSRECRRN